MNLCDLSSYLPTLHQYVDCPILDKCFGNIVDGYRAVCRPPLGRSDHNIIHLLPKYMFKQEKPVTKEIQLWTDQSKEELRDCFENTKWQLFFDACKDVHETPSHLTEVFVKVIVLRLK